MYMARLASAYLNMFGKLHIKNIMFVSINPLWCIVYLVYARAYLGMTGAYWRLYNVHGYIGQCLFEYVLVNYRFKKCYVCEY